jgi:hypothetical protein
MGRDVWKLQRDPNAKRAAVPEVQTTHVEIAIEGMDIGRLHIYDDEGPDRSPYPLHMVARQPAATQIYAKTFGVNFLDPEGKNAYAEMNVDEGGNVSLGKWVERSEGIHLTVDNTTRPVVITIQRDP